MSERIFQHNQEQESFFRNRRGRQSTSLLGGVEGDEVWGEGKCAEKKKGSHRTLQKPGKAP